MVSRCAIAAAIMVMIISGCQGEGPVGDGTTDEVTDSSTASEGSTEATSEESGASSTSSDALTDSSTSSDTDSTTTDIETDTDSTTTDTATDTSSTDTETVTGSTTDTGTDTDATTDLTATDTEPDTDATTDPPPVCGDGVVEGDEACDDGNADNTDACLDTCVPASCGDGLVFADEEECDNGGDDMDGCLSTCVIPRSCDQILGELAKATDGVYVIDPDGDGDGSPFAAYCDMTEDGGGWTLVAKVHRWHGGDSFDEPLGWFATERDVVTLTNTTSYEDRPEALASHGQARLAPIMSEVTQARFTIVAEDDIGQAATWFKAVDAGVWSWFTAVDHPATQVCTDVEMTMDCSLGKIRSTGTTFLEGMLLNHHGYQTINNGCPIHMRHNEDQGASFTAVCSCTLDYNNNAWHDDAPDGHWGNGLEIWFR